jgi:hypothetical protein
MRHKKNKFNIRKYKDIFTKKFLYREYIIKDKSLITIAKENNTTKTTVIRHLKNNNITTKYPGKPKGKYIGKKANGYIDGRTLKKYYCKCGKEIKYKSKHCKHCAEVIKWVLNNHIGIKGNQIIKHHIDLNKKNNKKLNILRLTQSKHNSLHQRAYYYLVKTNQIKNYIKWFIKYFKL